MDSQLNPEWEIHWTLTGQTHLYGWVDIGGLRCRVTMARLTQGGKVEVGLGTDPVPGTYGVVKSTMLLPSELSPTSAATWKSEAWSPKAHCGSVKSPLSTWRSNRRGKNTTLA